MESLVIETMNSAGTNCFRAMKRFTRATLFQSVGFRRSSGNSRQLNCASTGHHSRVTFPTPKPSTQTNQREQYKAPCQSCVPPPPPPPPPHSFTFQKTIKAHLQNDDMQYILEIIFLLITTTAALTGGKIDTNILKPCSHTEVSYIYLKTLLVRTRKHSSQVLKLI